MAYTTAAAVKTYGEISGPGHDTRLELLVPQAQAAIDRYCNRTFEASADSTRYFDAVRDVSDDFRTLYLDEDLCSITSVTNGDSTSVTGASYVTEPRNRTPYYALRLKDSATVSWTYDTTPENAISITGKWAFSATAPNDIVLACNRLVLYLFRNREGEGDRTIMNTSGMLVLPAQMPADVRDLLRPYRKIQV